MAIEWDYKFADVTIIENTPQTLEFTCGYITGMEGSDDFTSDPDWIAEFENTPATRRFVFTKPTVDDIDEISKSWNIKLLPSDYVIDINEWVLCSETEIDGSLSHTEFQYIGSSDKYEEFEYYYNILEHFKRHHAVVF